MLAIAVVAGVGAGLYVRAQEEPARPCIVHAEYTGYVDLNDPAGTWSLQKPR